MASVSLRDILGYVSLTSMVNTNVPDLPRRLPPGFYGGQSEKVEGNFFRYTTFTNARQNAQLTNYYAPSVPVQLRPIGQVGTMLFSSIENITFDAVILEALRNFEDYGLQEKGKVFVAKQIAEFRRRFKHLRDTAALLILCKGIVYRNSTGEVLPSSSGSAITSDFGVPAGNRGTIAAVSGVTGAWNSPTTQINLQLQAMKIIAQQAHGYIPEIILYGRNIPTYLSQNDSMIPYLSRNPEFRDEYVQKGYIRPTHDLCDFTWFPIADSGFNNSSGVYQLPIGNDDIIMLPNADSAFWEWAEGSYMFSNTLNVTSDLDSMLGSLTKVYGPFAYSFLDKDPARLIGVAGDNFTPFLKVPEVVYQMTAI